jgi:hypothetical protein
MYECSSIRFSPMSLSASLFVSVTLLLSTRTSCYTSSSFNTTSAGNKTTTVTTTIKPGRNILGNVTPIDPNAILGAGLTIGAPPVDTRSPTVIGDYDFSMNVSSNAKLVLERYSAFAGFQHRLLPEEYVQYTSRFVQYMVECQ